MAAKRINAAIDALRARIKGFLHDAGEEARRLWWHFFDWLALVQWRQLYIVCFLALVLSSMLQTPQAGVLFIITSAAVKGLAGAKRRAELDMLAAGKMAEVATLERRLLEAQMAALQAQVEPHFLFNTLALIGQLIETDPPEAARIHMHLIAYLRSSLPQMRAPGSATLGRQVALSRAYLAIMQARMKERLQLSFELPGALEDAAFPPMMLQTLIENAIKHGLEPKIEGGHISVRASATGTTLRVDVQDDGVGFNLHADDGVGLANIRERLRLLFGDAAQLIIEAPPGGGALASLRVPRAGAPQPERH